jgi:predicted enzyme related to lactoylglutathione lyase
MSSPIVYFEIAGPDGARLRSFFKSVFGWEIDGSSTIASRCTGGLRGGIREDPPDVLAKVEANGGSVVLPRTVVPEVVTFALFKDPAGNLLGVAENGSYAS